MPNRRPSERAPELEILEAREVPSVTSVWLGGSTIYVKSDNVSTQARVNQAGPNYVITDSINGRTWSFAANRVNSVEFHGGNGNDDFRDFVSHLTVRMWGGAGNDYLQGFNGNDYFDGGAGNDTIRCYGGNDVAFGGTGNDTILGMDGNDLLFGGDGDDHLNGGAGNDYLWGQNGNDVLIAIDSGTGDYVEGGAGRDAFWVDQNGSARDRVSGATSADWLQSVTSFANRADRTLNGDRIADPALTSGMRYQRFDGRPLFSSAGPKMDDIQQGYLGDCYLLAGLGAVALDNPTLLKSYVVDFDDGTYGVRLGDNFYRVDSDLPVKSSGGLAYAGLGVENSLWVAVVEKAFAQYRTGANSYASIESGNPVEVNVALGSAGAGIKLFTNYSNPTQLLNDIYQRWSGDQSVSLEFYGLGRTASTAGLPLIMSHAYTVVRFNRDSAGHLVSVVLRNPWGYDGISTDSNPRDGLVTVTASQIHRLAGAVDWGRV